MDGGGFINSPGGGGGGRDESSGQSCMTPVTLKQFAGLAVPAPGEKLMIEGHPSDMVMLVGRVVSLTPEEVMALIELEDGTGRVEVRHWAAVPAGVRVGAYIRVIGRATQGTPAYVQSLRIRLVEDMNETVYHMLDCAHVALLRRKGPLDELAAHAAPSAALGAGGAGASSSSVSLPDRILSVIRQTTSSDGASASDIAKVLGEDESNVISTAKDMVQDMLIYCTTDTTHYRVLT